MRVVVCFFLSLMVASCADPYLERSVPHAPRAWGRSDIVAVTGVVAPAVDSSALFSYAGESAGVEVAVPALRWFALRGGVVSLGVVGDGRRLAVGLRQGAVVGVRRGVWPGSAVVESAGLVATDWVALDAFAVDEVRCVRRDVVAPAHLRLTARLVAEGGGIRVVSGAEVRGAALGYCAGSEYLLDRLRGFAADVAIETQAARWRTVPVPVRW